MACVGYRCDQVGSRALVLRLALRVSMLVAQQNRESVRRPFSHVSPADEMKTSRIASCLSVAVLLIASHGVSGQSTAYEITRSNDGPFTFRVSRVTLNEGSSLERETILLNTPRSPIILSAASLGIDYEDRRFQFGVSATAEVGTAIRAFEVRHVLYDVFGEHLQNLSNTEARDIEPGATQFDGTWNVLRESDATELLTTVSFVARVRLANGQVWVFDPEELAAALASLNLEQQIEEEPGGG